MPAKSLCLGIHNLDVKNTALLSKWLYKLLTTEGTWQLIIRNIYLGSKPLSQVQWKMGTCIFLASLMKIKRDLRLHHRAGGCHYLRFEMVETDIVGLPNPICQLELLVNILCGNKTTRKVLKLPEEEKKNEGSAHTIRD